MQTMLRAVVLTAVVFGAGVSAQSPAPAPAAPTAPAEPTLPADLRLERDNLLLQARVNELETQLAALKAQFINDRIGQAAPALIQRLQAAAPGWDVNPQTLAMTPKAAAAAPPATGAPKPPAAPQP